MPADRLTGAILGVADKSVKTSTALRSEIAAHAPGSTVKLSVHRNGNQLELDVQLGASPAKDKRPEPEETERAAEPLAGATLQDLDARLRERLGVPEEHEGGVVVTGVAPGSAAHEAGLRAGDVILSINRTAVADVATLRKHYDAASGDVALLVWRGDTTIYVVVPGAK